MYKKLICLLLVILVAVSMFGCGSSELQKTISEQEEIISSLESQLQKEKSAEEEAEKSLSEEKQQREAAEKKLEAYEASEQEEQENTKEGIVVTLTDKYDMAMSQYLQDVYRYAVMEVSVTNNTGKDISGIDGYAYFYDMFGHLLMQIGADFAEEVIKDGETKVYTKSYTCNMYITEESRFCNATFENTKLVYQIKKVVFADGTVLNYG